MITVQGDKGDKGDRGLTATFKGDKFATGIIEGPPGPPGPPGNILRIFISREGFFLSRVFSRNFTLDFNVDAVVE